MDMEDAVPKISANQYHEEVIDAADDKAKAWMLNVSNFIINLHTAVYYRNR